MTIRNGTGRPGHSLGLHTVSGPGYAVTITADGAPKLHIAHPRFDAVLALDIAVDTPEMLDADNAVVRVRTTLASNGRSSISLEVTSSAWAAKVVTITLVEDALELQATVTGERVDRIDQVLYFRRHASAIYPRYNPRIRHLNDRLQPDPIENTVGLASPFDAVYAPEPNSYARWWFEPFEAAQISPHADLDHMGGNFIFNPGPLCFVGRRGDAFVALGVIAPPGERGFTEYAHLGGRHLGLCLRYWGRTTAENVFRTPTLRIGFATGLDEALINYRESLNALGLIPSGGDPPADWWSGPIACGWGQQSYMGDLFRMRSPATRGRDEAVYAMCTQHNYTAFVEALDRSRLDWSTLVVDARWTIEAGTKMIDMGRWPDLPGFIARLHAANKKVLLWWGPWEHEGLPPHWCIHLDSDRPEARRNRAGRFAKFGASQGLRPIAPDPCHTDYAAFIAQRIRFLLSDEPGCCGADGFKVDHVSATPGAYGLIYPAARQDPVFGLDLLHRQLRQLYVSAKAAKPHALIIGQSPNAFFSDCQDVVRLGDIYAGTDSVVAEMSERARLVRLAHPEFGIDTDGWPMPSVQALLEYAAVQPVLGVPSIYYATALDTTGESVPSDVLNLVQDAWSGFG